MTAATGFFVTGTDTNVGKTRVTVALAKSWRAAGQRVGVYKPAASGCVVNPVLCSATSSRGELFEQLHLRRLREVACIAFVGIDVDFKFRILVHSAEQVF